MAITQRQIAQAVGVSHGAVSQVLHGSRQARISPLQQQKIRDMARQMGYRPRTLTTHTIGYVLPVEDLRLLGEANFLIHVENALRLHGYRLVLVEDNGDDTQMKELLNSKTVDGVLLMRWNNGHLRDLLAVDVPWVLLATEPATPGTDRVTVDLKGTVAGVVRHLADHGHRRICLVTGCLEVDFHTQLWDALRSTCKLLSPHMQPGVTAGLDVNMETALLSRLRVKDPPTAFITGSAEKAVIALNLLTRQGYQIPRDLSLVSLFDLPLFSSLRPLITATDAMSAEVAEIAVNRLMAKIQDPQSPTEEIFLPGQVVSRDSVACLDQSLSRSGSSVASMTASLYERTGDPIS